MNVNVAISQMPPVLLDQKKTMDRALQIIEEAAAKEVRLIVFPEAFFPGYPTWIWRLRPGGDMALGNEIHARLRANAIDISRGDLTPLCKAAKRHGMVVVAGMNEVDSEFSGTTLFNTVVIIGPQGDILNRHRKLMPTNPERMVWGEGDASGVRVVDTPVGRIGCLICWESYMPLARYALYAQNIDIYIAPTWDCGDMWTASMNHIAREGGCWVLSSATAMQGVDVPGSFPGRNQLFADDKEWINSGDAIVVKPFGGVIAGPMHEEKGVLYETINLDAARESRKSLDVTGHYARSDIFHLEVDRTVRPPVSFSP